MSEQLGKLVITNMVLIITLSDLIAIYGDHNSIERGSYLRFYMLRK